MYDHITIGMTPEQERTHTIKWNEVTWYSRLAAIIVCFAVIPAISFYIGEQYESAMTSAVPLSMPAPVNPIKGSAPISSWIGIPLDDAAVAYASSQMRVDDPSVDPNICNAPEKQQDLNDCAHYLDQYYSNQNDKAYDLATSTATAEQLNSIKRSWDVIRKTICEDIQGDANEGGSIDDEVVATCDIRLDLLEGTVLKEQVMTNPVAGNSQE